jgi:hypothetical protein
LSLNPIASQPQQYVLVAGVAQAIPVKTFARRVKLSEDGGAGGGFAFTYPNGVTVNIPPGGVLELGDIALVGRMSGNFIGVPVQDGSNARPADTYGTVLSAAGSKLNVWEYE